MSIKSDKWIRRMSEQHGMIEPFESGQVRETEKGRVISYGTSSYGYDVRCAPEFKVFTNINAAVVDPKAFTESSFVDIEADVCIVPPNSFALARTVGWVAQWTEMIEDPHQRISRPRQLYVGSEPRDYVAIEER